MSTIEEFENAPVGATATHKGTGHRAMKTYEDGWSWVTLIGRYLGDKEMEYLDYTLDPPAPESAREALDPLYLCPLPTREEIAMAIAAYHWDKESGDVEVWHDLTLGEREAVAENYLTWDSADAVLALLKGQDV